MEQDRAEKEASFRPGGDDTAEAGVGLSISADKL